MRKLIIYSIVIIVVVCGGYVYWNYYNSYSEGYTEGILQNFSRKGNVLKTFEGEIVDREFDSTSGIINPRYFYFSVTNPAIADSLNNCVGRVMRLHYTQYRRSLPWRGDNYNDKNHEKGQYIVDKVVKNGW